MKHSLMGILSFTASVIVCVLMFCLLAFAGVMYERSREAGEDAYPGQALVGLAVILLCFVDLAALGLGIASVVQKDDKRTFGIIGLSLSAGTLLLVIGVFIVGLQG